jgi:hypothetical protein
MTFNICTNIQIPVSMKHSITPVVILHITLLRCQTSMRNLVQVLETFVSQHLLHWIEVMSLVGEISRAEKCLQFLAKWMKVGIHTSH